MHTGVSPLARAHDLNRLNVLAFIVVLFGSFSQQAAYATDTGITVGVLAFRGDELAKERWEPTTDYLTAALPGYDFRLVPLDLHGMNEALERGTLDFILTNPGNYVELEAQYGITRIATLRNVRQGQVYKEFGAVIFTRADRDDIRELADLKHASFAAVDSAAFGGFQMAWRELAEAGIDPLHDFTELKFIGFPQDEVVFQVRDGKVDAGTVRTDVLERMASQGVIDLDDYRILNSHVTSGFPFRHSTRLYPEWAFAKAKQTSDELAKAVTLALLNMPADHPAAVAGKYAGWTVPLDYQRVHELFKALQIGPYAHFGEFTFSGIMQRYWYVFAVLLAILGFSIFHNIRVERLVGQRTAELVRTNRTLEEEISERKRAEEESRSLLKENRFLIRKSLAVQEDERRHLARELHDELGQCITAIQADAETIRDVASRKDTRVTASAKAILDVSAHLYDVVHCMIQRTRPGVLDDLGLVVALEDLVNDCRARFPGVDYDLTTAGELNALGEKINITIYRIVQECMTNIAKHAAATRVRINLTVDADPQGGAPQAGAHDVVSLVVRDDGRGMDTAGSGRGLGIAGMRERVEALGGHFAIHGIPDGGVMVSAVIPVDATAQEGV
jgi:two-component system sensor histidine kinase TtrS